MIFKYNNKGLCASLVNRLVWLKEAYREHREEDFEKILDSIIEDDRILKLFLKRLEDIQGGLIMDKREKMINAICEYLGVELNEEFMVEFNDGLSVYMYKMTNKGLMRKLGNREWELTPSIVDLISDNWKVVKLPKVNKDEVELLQSLKNMGVISIVKENSIIYCYGPEGISFMDIAPYRYQDNFNKNIEFKGLQESREYKIDELLQGLDDK